MRLHISRAPQFTYRKADRLKANIIINGQLLCACCLDGFPPSQCTDARIETDGEQTIKVQDGWTYIEALDTLLPNYAIRKIPRTIRGPICVSCMVHHNGKPLANADDRMRAQQRRPFERLRSGHAREGYGFPVISPDADHVYTRPEGDESGEHMVEWKSTLSDRDYLDPDPTWAHTNDPSWLSPTAIVNVRYPRGLNTGFYVRRGESPKRSANGSMAGWDYVPAYVLPRKPEQRMVDFPAVQTFNPLADIDRSIVDAGRPWGLPSRAYLDTLTARVMIAPVPEPKALPQPLGDGRLAWRLTPCLISIGVPIPERIKCRHGLLPVTCSHCKPRH